jgi:hypothetical protein
MEERDSGFAQLYMSYYDEFISFKIAGIYTLSFTCRPTPTRT